MPSPYARQSLSVQQLELLTAQQRQAEYATALGSAGMYNTFIPGVGPYPFGKPMTRVKAFKLKPYKITTVPGTWLTKLIKRFKGHKW